MYTEKKERNVREQWIFRTVFFFCYWQKEKKRGREKVREMPAVQENFSCLLCSFQHITEAIKCRHERELRAREQESNFRKSFSSMTTIMVTLRKSTNFTPYSVFLSAAIKSSFLYKQILVLSKEFQLVLVKITKFSKSFPHIKHNKKPEVFNLSWKH